MRNTTLLVPVTGVAALVLSATLAGCGSASKSTSSSSVPGSAESSASSASASSAPAAATQPGPPGSPTVTLPELPGWSGDSALLNAHTTEADLAALHYDKAPDASTLIVGLIAADNVDQANSMASAASNKANTDCAFQGTVDEISISGFQGFKDIQNCAPATGSFFQERRSIVVPNPNGAAWIVLMLGTAKPDLAGALTDAMALIDAGTTITVGQ